MLTVLFIISLLWVVWKIGMLGVRMAWGITKFVFGLIVFPVLVAGMFFLGLVYLAIPILIIAGIVALIGGLASA